VFDEYGIARPVKTDEGYLDYVERLESLNKKLRDMNKLTNTGRPGIRSMLRAFCFQCMGGFHDGRVDCETPHCPLYTMQPYRKMEPDYTWVVAGPHVSIKDRFIPAEMSVSGEDEYYRSDEKEKADED
jgi:hypothetical protein